jgi:hypothetical protein
MEAAEALEKERQVRAQIAANMVRQPPASAEPSSSEPRPEPQQQQPTIEQIIAGAAVPDAAKNWLRQHPDYVSDPVKNAKLIKMHNVAEYQAGSEFTPAYFERMEILLGLRQERPPPQANSGNGTQRPAPAVQRQSAPISAPPSRKVPSMSGQYSPSQRDIVLSKEQQEIVESLHNSRPDLTRAQAEELYKYHLRRYQKMQQDGEITDQGMRGR